MPADRKVRLFTFAEGEDMNRCNTVKSLAPPPARRRAATELVGALGAVALLASGGCALAPGTREDRPGAPARDAAYTPALFQAVAPDKAKLLLFGTMHIGRPEFFPLPAPALAAFAEATSVAVEIDVAQRWPALIDAFRPRVRFRIGQTLSKVMSPELLQRIRAYFGYSDSTWLEIETLQPWWVSNFRFTTAADRQTGGIESLGIERHVLELSRKAGKTIIELETVDEQVHALAGGSLAEQCAQFEHWFEVVVRRGGLVHELLPAWQRGDLTMLALLKEQTWPATGPLASLRRRFFSEREQRMADRLTTIAGEQQQPVFVAIGAYHLVGPDSLLAALSTRGFEIRRLSGSTVTMSGFAASVPAGAVT